MLKKFWVAATVMGALASASGALAAGHTMTLNRALRPPAERYVGEVQLASRQKTITIKAPAGTTLLRGIKGQHVHAKADRSGHLLFKVGPGRYNVVGPERGTFVVERTK
jgi:hypothetical protein